MYGCRDGPFLASGAGRPPRQKFVVFDDRFRYRFANEALAKLHRVPSEAHEGERLRRIVGDAASKIESALETVFGFGKGAYTI